MGNSVLLVIRGELSADGVDGQLLMFPALLPTSPHEGSFLSLLPSLLTSGTAAACIHWTIVNLGASALEAGDSKGQKFIYLHLVRSFIGTMAP